VQVNEIATATMMAAKGAIYPVYQLMRDEQEAFAPSAYLPARDRVIMPMSTATCSRFRSTPRTPILYYNKDLFRDGRPRSGGAAEDLAGRRFVGREKAARSRRGLRLHHLMAVLDQCREFRRVS